MILKLVPDAPDIMLQALLSLFSWQKLVPSLHGFLEGHSLWPFVRNDVQSDGTCTHALTYRNDIPRISAKSSNVVVDPYISRNVSTAWWFVDVYLLAIKGSTLVSQPSIGLIRNFEGVIGGETEYYVLDQCSRGKRLRWLAYSPNDSSFQHRSLAGRSTSPVAPDHLVGRAGQMYSQLHCHPGLLSATTNSPLSSSNLVPPCSQAKTGNFADASVPDDREILKLRRFSLTLVIGLVNGSGAAPIP